MNTRKHKIHNIISDFRNLIDNAPKEGKVQQFLEVNPFLVSGGHHIDHDVIISQLPLGAEYRVDFAYLYHHSGGAYIQLIEIESPKLRIFNNNNEFTQEFNHAIQQIFDWIAWTQQHLDYLVTLLGPFLDYGAWPPKIVHCKLIAGRREELNNIIRRQRWSMKKNKLPSELEVVTFDGFIEKIPIGQYVHHPNFEIKCVTYKNRSFFEKEISRTQDY